MLNTPFTPMILKKADKVPTSPNYIHQYKWDGHRLLFHYNQGKIKLFTREMNECTLQYPELHLISLPVENCILDGECIVLDPSTNPPVPCFESVMTRFKASREITIKRYMESLPVHFVVWDIVFLNGKKVAHMELSERLKVLDEIVLPNNMISITPSFEDGEALFKAIVEIGGEGVVSKPKNSRYRFGSCSDHNAWLKTKNYQYEDVYIGAIQKKKFGWSLLLNNKYVGVLEFPPSNKQIASEFYKLAKKYVYKETKDWIFLEPVLRCKVKFQSYTKDGKLRSPSFVEFV
ncbi:DNA polymerase LigD (plasmid) [Paenibacillus thiaminolyticus]|uniref:ATP-dependent DNA ligase n=1 Tax=Paenibacillus thiaminolyticus TaxID=49283 RepID=UPI00232FBA42|nr:DNA polymerase LigD [Paenibacillus thiaminolyticus]WCF11555.1 DNA polymerase LigD [Paenibacillus thiaminolyticus]